jgi:hypothetical protein
LNYFLPSSAFDTNNSLQLLPIPVPDWHRYRAVLSPDPQFLPAEQHTLSRLHVAETENHAKQLLWCSTIDATV